MQPGVWYTRHCQHAWHSHLLCANTVVVFASQKFAESLLEVADNLESAARAVPQGVLQEGADVPAETSLKYLKSLLEGVQATERVLLKVGQPGVWQTACQQLC